MKEAVSTIIYPYMQMQQHIKTIPQIISLHLHKNTTNSSRSRRAQTPPEWRQVNTAFKLTFDREVLNISFFDQELMC